MKTFLSLGLIFTGSLFAQVVTHDIAFDVASLKPSPPATGDLININLGTARNGEVTLGNATLSDCIKFAWGLVSDLQISGPDWIKYKLVRFDVIAKAPPSTPREQLLLMLRTLLQERFKLQMHIEEKRITHYSLSIARGGTKLQEAETIPAVPSLTYRIGHLADPAMPMHKLALLLSRQTGEMVLDETGLKGVYNVRLEWTPENNPSVAETTETGPSIFTAVREQLGLKLELRKEPVAVRVVDHAEKVPVPN